MAARFWVTTGTTGGTGNWSNAQNWSATSGGTAGASVPGSTDTATFDASSGVGTASIDSSVTIQTLTMASFTGTLSWLSGNTLSLNSTGTVFTGGTGCSTAGVPIINVTNTGSTAITVSPAGVTESNAISFNFTGGTYALSFLNTASHAVKNVDFTGFSGTWNATSTGVIYGNLTLSTGMTLTASASAMSFSATSGTQIITSNTKTFDFPLTVTSSSVVQLADALTLTATRTFTLTTGTLNLNNMVLTTGIFNSNNTNARGLAFGTGYIICNGSSGGTLFSLGGSGAILNITGTPVVQISYSGATAVTVTAASSTSNYVSYKFTTGTYTLTFLNTIGYNANNIDFTGFGGTWGARTNAASIYGNLTLSSVAGFSVAASTGALNFVATSGTQIITSRSKTIDAPLTINGVGGTVQLFDPLTLGALRTLTLTNGAFDLNNQAVTTGLFSSSGGNVRSIAFGSTSITCNAAGGTLWTTAVVTNLTVTGTPVVNISNSGAVATTVASGALSEAQGISFNFNTGTYALTFLGTASYAAKNINFTGFAGTWNSTAANFIYGSLTLSTGMTLTASANVMRFAASSGTQIITSNGKTIDLPVIIQGTGSAVVQLADALTLGATRVLSILTGTLDGNNKTISGASSININISSCGAYTIKNISTALTWNTGSSSIVTLGGPCTFGAVNMTNNPISIDLATYQLTCTTFTSTGGGFARTITFGTGSNITCNGAGGILVSLAASIYGLTLAGTPIFNISYSGASAVVIGSGQLDELNAPSFNFTTGTYSLTFLGNGGDSAKNVNFSGFGGTWAAHSTGTIYGNLTMSSVAGFSAAATANALTFGATSGTQIITSNAKTHDYPITLNGVGGTVRLADALLMGTTRILTHTNGTLDLNGKTLTVGTQYQTATGTKNLTFNGGTLVCPAAAVTAFNNAVPAGFTTTAGTGTGKISMTGATAKTFVGGGSTYNCTLSNDGAGALTVSGSNTFTTIANGVQPTQFTFTSGTTTTVTNWNVSGISGSLVTVISSTAGTAATISKASGTIYAYYISLKDSAATGGANWYVPYGYNSVNVSGNSGWVFGVARYKVSGTSLNWSNTANWSATSGGASGASAPSFLDGVIFDSLSPQTTVTLDVSPEIWSFDSSAAGVGNGSNIVFGGFSININGTMGTVCNPRGTLDFSSTPVININSTGSSAITVLAANESINRISFNFTGGNYALDFFGPNEYPANVNFTGFSGSWFCPAGVATNKSMAGNLTLSPTMTITPSVDDLVINGDCVLTSNGVTINMPVSFTGTGSTYILTNDTTIVVVSGTACSITRGTLNLNGKTLNTNLSFSSTGNSAKNITFNGGTIITGSGFSVTGTLFSATSGTGSGTISMTRSTAKTFAGGGFSYPCTVSNDGNGTLTISGNNTIDTITRTAGNISITGSNTINTLTTAALPVTFTFTAGTTQTITNWNLNGTAGNLVTILSSVAGTPATVSKASGTVSADYLSLKDSTATGGAAWYAGANSTNVSGNSGWIFTAPPVVTAGGNFFFMF
jgi:hypothetical protein